MNRTALLQAMFPSGWTGHSSSADSFTGTARVGAQGTGPIIQVIGSSDAAEVGGDLALLMARTVLDTIRDHPRRPILFLLDTRGQRLRRRDEMLGLNGYMAHLAKCVEMARHRGHPIISVVYGQAVSGGYLTTGMMADACYALADAEIKVMNLPAMARITKIPLQRLEELAAQSPVFSPGVDNYFRMGHVLEVWSDDLAAHLESALATASLAQGDSRMRLGEDRGGRKLARPVAQQVLNHA